MLQAVLPFPAVRPVFIDKHGPVAAASHTDGQHQLFYQLLPAFFLIWLFLLVKVALYPYLGQYICRYINVQYKMIKYIAPHTGYMRQSFVIAFPTGGF
jgi:hypothetical protein